MGYLSPPLPPPLRHPRTPFVLVPALQDGWSPLHIASFNGRRAVVEALLAGGADPRATDQVRTPTSSLFSPLPFPLGDGNRGGGR